jgi:hypothetical protein
MESRLCRRFDGTRDILPSAEIGGRVKPCIQPPAPWMRGNHIGYLTLAKPHLPPVTSGLITQETTGMISQRHTVRQQPHQGLGILRGHHRRDIWPGLNGDRRILPICRRRLVRTVARRSCGRTVNARLRQNKKIESEQKIARIKIRQLHVA